MSEEIARWADVAMFEAKPMQVKEGLGRVTPQVTLLSVTPDPLGVLTAGFRMYAGDPVYSLDELTNEDRLWGWEESLKTHLKAPWEFIDLVFMIEGVTRAFTHQIVRQRTAVYAQESLRFAVKRGFAKEAALPASLQGDEDYEGNPTGPAKIWDDAVKGMEQAYMQLVDAGIPAEDARGLLPHCRTTLIMSETNSRGLIHHAGNRLCTQAQFEWRSVFMGMMMALKDYQPPGFNLEHQHRNSWQFQTLAQPIAQTFTPVCYKAGRCVFMGKLDRGCTIRDRANEGAFDKIEPMEWLANPLAGITHEETDRPQS